MNDATIGELLDELVPLRPEMNSDWNAVLSRAGVSVRMDAAGYQDASAAPLDGVRHREIFRRVGRRRVARVVMVVAVASVVFAVVALWPGNGPTVSILQRALAAVGDGAVIHVVYRDEMHETLIDLATGQKTPLYEEHDEWYDPSNGGLREVTTFNGKQTQSFTYGADKVSSQARQTYAGILDGYRTALTNGTATIVGRNSIAGRDVIWIAFKGQQLYDVGDQRYDDWSHEVAVDAATYLPVYLRETRDGEPGGGTGQQILSVDTAAAGSIDFTPSPTPKPTPFVMGATDNVDLTLQQLKSGAASAALSAPAVWLGERYDNLPLAYAQTRQLIAGHADAPEHIAAVDICYGTALSVPPQSKLSANPAKNCDTNQPYVELQESTKPSQATEWDLTNQVTIPDGSVLIGWGGKDGFLIRNGVYIHIRAVSEDAVVAAATELTQFA